MANCSERACPFPAEEGGSVCRYHRLSFEFDVSLSDSSLGDPDQTSAFSLILKSECSGIGHQRYFFRFSRYWDSEGRCPGCGAERDQETKYCAQCLHEAKALQETLIALGLCPSCRLPRTENGRFYCLACADRDNRKHRRRYAARRASGICVKCGRNKTSVPHSNCENCLKRLSEIQRKRSQSLRPARTGGLTDSRKGIRAERVRMGMCRDCGKNPIERRNLFCRQCYENIILGERRCEKRLRERRKVLGLCRDCSAPTNSQLSLCDRCLAKRRTLRDPQKSSTKWKARYQRLRALGLCTKCKREIETDRKGKSKCNTCLRKYMRPKRLRAQFQRASAA